MDSLEEIFKECSKKFAEENSQLLEIVFLFGGTILTPKQIYRLVLPDMELGHAPKNHSERPIMADILR